MFYLGKKNTILCSNRLKTIPDKNGRKDSQDIHKSFANDKNGTKIKVTNKFVLTVPNCC